MGAECPCEPLMKPMDPGAELQLRAQVKNELRARMKAVRRVLPESARAERSALVRSRLLNLEAFGKASAIAIYLPMRTEVDTLGFIEDCIKAGKALFAPRLSEDASELELRALTEHDTELAEFGFRQPVGDSLRASLESIDIVLVPALAVDERGHRIGYGKGYYDRLLPHLPNALRVAVAFDFQLLAEIPNTAGDEPVDVVVTDLRTVHTASRFG